MGQWNRVGEHHWKVRSPNLRASFFDCGGQVLPDSLDHIADVHRFEGRVRRPCGLTVGQEIGDQHFHSLSAFDTVAKVSGGFAIQLVRILLLQKLAVDGDLSERLLKVVTRGVSKLLQIGIGAPKLFVRVPEQILIPFSIRNILRNETEARASICTFRPGS